MTVFVSFLWIVISSVDSRSFLVMSSCLSWASSHDMTVFASFIWIVISFAGPCSFLVMSSGFAGFSASLLGTFLYSSVLWVLFWLWPSSVLLFARMLFHWALDGRFGWPVSSPKWYPALHVSFLAHFPVAHDAFHIWRYARPHLFGLQQLSIPCLCLRNTQHSSGWSDPLSFSFPTGNFPDSPWRQLSLQKCWHTALVSDWLCGSVSSK